MPDEFIALEPQDGPIGYFSLQATVFDCGLQLFFKGLKELLPTLVVEITTLEVSGKVFWTQNTRIDETKNERIDDKGFEDLGNIQTKREAAFPGFMEIAYRGIERRPVTL